MHEDGQLTPDPTTDDGQAGQPAEQSAERTAAEPASPPREAVELDLEEYVLEWFQAQGENYEDLMNQVLRDYIAAEEAAAKQSESGQDGK